MSSQASSNPLKMRVQLRPADHQHFEDMNDFICFQRHKVKDFTWNHGALNQQSYLDIEFHNVTDALMFKLKYG